MNTVSKIKWRLNRLSLMSPLEMGSRLKEELKKQFIHSENVRIPNWNIKEIRQPQWLSDKAFSRDFILSTGLWNEDEAKALLNYEFDFFSFSRKKIIPPINWHRDYKNEVNAPAISSTRLDIQEINKTCDIKYVWEINRHQHLTLLAKAYYLTGKEEYRNEVLSQMESWIDQNPYLVGVNWLSSLEAGIRLIAWYWIQFFLGDFPAELDLKIRKSIYQHCNFICGHFSNFSSANNHLIGEAAGLLIGALTWDFGKDSKRWVGKSKGVLVREIEQQIFSEGSNREQASDYLFFILDFLILAGLIGEKNGCSFPRTYWDRIEASVDYLASMMDIQGNVPAYGDSDDGLAFLICETSKGNPARSLLNTGAVLFSRGDLKGKAGGRLDEKSLWLLGQEGESDYQQLTPKKFSVKQDFSESGHYLLLKNPETEHEIRGRFNCGPLGYLSIAAHGHADALQFTLAVGGKEFLIDPGTYTYHGGSMWREYFRSTAAHNTIEIDGQSQSVSGGSFMWLKKAEASCLGFSSSSTSDSVSGRHLGYTRFKKEIIHERHIHLDKTLNQFFILDKLTGDGQHDLKQLFHLDSQCQVKKEKANIYFIQRQNVWIRIVLDDRLVWNLYQGSENPILGWQSKSFDRKVESPTLAGEIVVSQKVEIKTKIEIGFLN